MSYKNCNFKLRYVDFLFSNKIILKKLPLEISCLIYRKYINLHLYKIKWIKIYNRISFKRYQIIDELHLFHDLAHRITELAHKFFLYDFNLQGNILINLSQKIHFLISLLIKDTIKYK